MGAFFPLYSVYSDYSTLSRKKQFFQKLLRETNSEEKKAQQERKKVLDIQEKHTINRTILIVLYKVQIIG